jgi:hypothetical protein
MNTCTKSYTIAKQIKLLSASIFMLGASVAYADPATIIDGFFCQTLFPGVGPVTTVTEGHKVITDKGITVLTCHFDHPYDLDYAIGEQGFPCWISTPSGLIVTTDSQNIAAPGGRAALVCKVNGADVMELSSVER